MIDNDVAQPAGAGVELKVCPFCGGEAAWGEGEQKTKYGNEQVYCSNCYAMTAPEATKKNAALRWNIRGEAPELNYVRAIEGDINTLKEQL